ncbi:hypothetical protein B0H34DRAFT_713187 [Crassisporium funariophilum]|nr:hypothetical protein B0H34DRAFT_713187 [Crassisporium funariophilum]
MRIRSYLAHASIELPSHSSFDCNLLSASMATLRPKPLLYFSVIGLITVFTFYHYLTAASLFRHPLEYIQHLTHPNWSSPYTGFLTRATPHPNPHSYKPSRSSLKLVALQDGPVDPQAFTIALFSDHTCVNHKGHIFTLTPADYEGIMELADDVNKLPPTPEFRNQWRVAHPRTGFAIDRILVPLPDTTLPSTPLVKYADEYKETGVYGFDEHATRLEEPVNGIKDLPGALWELTGLVLEAINQEGDYDGLVLERVKGILGNVF